MLDDRWLDLRLLLLLWPWRELLPLFLELRLEPLSRLWLLLLRLLLFRLLLLRLLPLRLPLSLLLELLL